MVCISLHGPEIHFFSSRAKPERAGIESKSDLVQRTERHLTEPAEPDQEALTGTSTNFYSPKYYLAYLGYPPLFFAGKHRSWLAVPVVFLFVGFWHERTGWRVQCNVCIM
eukprot:g33174.t1